MSNTSKIKWVVILGFTPVKYESQSPHKIFQQSQRWITSLDLLMITIISGKKFHDEYEDDVKDNNSAVARLRFLF